ncbi:hypothetical protein [Nocardia aurantia]|uniref:Uncharacterized protein n=1 Tax=Nocardia aurantia TaxID=2585199 RepID=A0A7K0DU43_9NOCA|nr:hypothetical protein [Nocardia aurantia]MQY29283.1 hypothetical protein [Nocardia aurantia]
MTIADHLTPGPGLGTDTYRTGCTYTIAITGDPGDQVVRVKDQVYRNGAWDHAATGTFGPVSAVAARTARR